MTDLPPHERESPTQPARVHPAASVFPEMSPAALKELAEDIRQNGLVHAITRTADGVVLDGITRLKACEMAGVEPRFEVYAGSNPVGFIVSSNLKRRQLNESQRALIAAQLATLARGQHQAAGENAEQSGPTEAQMRTKSAAFLLRYDMPETAEEQANNGASPEEDQEIIEAYLKSHSKDHGEKK
jgi:hypothetical protein